MNIGRLVHNLRRLENVLQRRRATAISKAIAAELPGKDGKDTHIEDPGRERWALVAHAGCADPAGLIRRWEALIRASPGDGVDAWFRITRALARHLDTAALATWLDRTRDRVVADAPDKLRVERYVDLFTHAYARELRGWRSARNLRALREDDPPAQVLDHSDPLCVRDALAAEETKGRARRLVLQQHAPPPRAHISPLLSALRDEQLARLQWSPQMVAAPGPADLLMLPNARFVAYRHDNRGGIVFDSDRIVPRLCNEHYMLDMTGHARCREATRREALAFAPVSACPLNHYHELMDTFASLVFLDLLPPGTPVVVPKRYEVLRPLYEAAGIAWSSLREYAELDTTVFDRMIAPVGGASRGAYPAFFARIASRLAAASGVRGRRLYLSRRKIANRPLVNEAEIEAVAARHGFEIVHAQELDFLAQCQLMAESAVLLGPHGAAFGNLLFAPQGTLVIEIKCPDYKVPVTFEMATECGQQYLPIVGDGFRDALGGDFGWHVDPARVDRALSVALAEAPAPAERLPA